MQIVSLTHHGQGRADDGTLIARVLPGEEVELRPDGAARILSPSPDRVAPPCRHYRACGGCAMQHASDALVAGWKRDVVLRALCAQGIEAEVLEPETSPPGSRRRAKLSGRRTKAGAIVGFHASASDNIVEVPECLILTPVLRALLPALEAITRRGASRRGEIGLTVCESLSGPDLRVDGGLPLDPALRSDLARIAGEAGIARLSWGDEPVAQSTPPMQAMGTARVVPPPGAFLQATREGEAALIRHVRSGVAGARRVADLFAGCGTFALPLAEVAEVHAVEGEAAMVEALDRGWRGAAGLRRVTTEARDLFRRPLLSSDLDRFDAIVIDPPRAGAEAQMHEIAGSGVASVVMVSCNPVTFARDVRILADAGFRCGPVAVVDQFRWSSHVEIVSHLTR